jgi:hypothetical protein
MTLFSTATCDSGRFVLLCCHESVPDLDRPVGLLGDAGSELAITFSIMFTPMLLPALE